MCPGPAGLPLPLGLASLSENSEVPRSPEGATRPSAGKTRGGQCRAPARPPPRGPAPARGEFRYSGSKQVGARREGRPPAPAGRGRGAGSGFRPPSAAGARARLPRPAPGREGSGAGPAGEGLTFLAAERRVPGEREEGAQAEEQQRQEGAIAEPHLLRYAVGAGGAEAAWPGGSGPERRDREAAGAPAPGRGRAASPGPGGGAGRPAGLRTGPGAAPPAPPGCGKRTA